VNKKMQETFKKRIVRIGSSAGIIIPAYLIKEGKFEEDKKYTITITDDERLE